ncbi:hypothetical protein KC315_g6633 [Hortaea werneckii]|nr:hypothetical protein KC315_g6633 [Hortaea werneckii]
MPKNERYYSQQSLYTPLGESQHDPSDPFSSHVALDDLDSDYEKYRSGIPSPAQSPAPPTHGYENNAPPNQNPLNRQPTKQKSTGFAAWSRKKKLMVIGGAIAAVVIIAIVLGVAIPLSQQGGGSYDLKLSTAQVTNQTAFEAGGATNADPWTNLDDGVGAGEDSYTYYSGDTSNFPSSSKWVSFKDMWSGNYHNMLNSCKHLGYKKKNTPQFMEDIYSAIQNRSAASLVDHRFILATILQESHGCVWVGETTSISGVNNPGLMQSHNGHKYASSHSNSSILQMVSDGTAGTSGDEGGDGLVQNLNLYGALYNAARGYNSGYIPKSGNLSDPAGATACYVSDIANRLTGWVNATSKCTED